MSISVNGSKGLNLRHSPEIDLSNAFRKPLDLSVMVGLASDFSEP